MRIAGYMLNRGLLIGLVVLLIAGLGGAQASYIATKAYLAQVLMEHAWTHETQVTHQPAKPWAWADMATTARLRYQLDANSRVRSLIVLDNASGEAMAFGPGLVAGELNNASQTTIALGGHRDTHLAFLEHADERTTFELQAPDGKILRYRFDDSLVVNTTTEQLQIATNLPGLVLITCYPFSAMQTGGPLRFVVRARLIDG